MVKYPLKAIVVLLLLFMACGSKEPQGSQPMSASDFTLPSLAGENITLSNLKGKVVLVDFWATWCPPCKNAIPHLIDLYEKFKDQGFVVLGISPEDEKSLEKFRDDYKITYPILLGTQEVAQAYGVQAIPKSIFIDKKGIVRKIQVGFAPELAPVFEALVDSLVKE